MQIGIVRCIIMAICSSLSSPQYAGENLDMEPAELRQFQKETMTIESPSVSVIVPTYARNEPLCETLDALRDQTFEQYDIHIVDDTDIHDSKTEVYLSELPSYIEHHDVDTDGPGSARNYGIDASKGDVLVFVDDDVRLSESFVETHAKIYDNEDVGAVVGQVLTPRHPEPVDAPPIGQATWYGQIHARLHANQRGVVGQGRGCNMSVRREALDTVGGYDSYLHYREEADLLRRIHKDGWKVVFNPEASVFHREYDEGGTGLGSQLPKEQLEEISQYETYFQLKHFPLIAFPGFLVFTLARQVKRRNGNPIAILTDIRPMLNGVLSGWHAWRSDR